jgi:sarcosine oxidase, subunit gamma
MRILDLIASHGVSVPAVGTRFGVKGSDAPAWLQYLGLTIPARPNSVTHWSPQESFGAGRCLRQGSTEFLIELDADEAPALPAHAAFPNAWKLTRSDHSLLLGGSRWPRALGQICSFDFARLDDEPDLVVMTLMAGISVTLIRESLANSTTSLRLWCDATFSSYLQQCLHSLGGSR